MVSKREFLKQISAIADRHQDEKPGKGLVIDIYNDIMELEEKEELERSATMEELAKIKEEAPKLYVDNPDFEATSEEIAAMIGIRHNRGTSQSIGRAVKKYLLTHQKDAAE